MFWSTLPDLSEKIMSWPHWEEVFEPQRKHSIRKYLELKKLSRKIGYYYSYSGEFMMFPTGKSWTCPNKDHKCVQVHPITASFPIAHPTLRWGQLRFIRERLTDSYIRSYTSSLAHPTAFFMAESGMIPCWKAGAWNQNSCGTWIQNWLWGLNQKDTLPSVKLT